jgi:stress-induced morphogen
MAAKQGLTKKQIENLTKQVVEGFAEQKIKATADLEPSELPGRYRLYVVSNAFEKLSEAERQDILWRILKDRWTRTDQLRITLSLALSEKEAQGVWS